MALNHGAPLKSSILGIYTTAGECRLFATKDTLNEKRVVMGQGAPSPVFAKGWPLSQSPVGTSTLLPHCMLHICPGSAHFTDEGTDPDMATEVPKGTCKPHKPWFSIVLKPAWANPSAS